MPRRITSALWGLSTCSFEDYQRPAITGEIVRYPDECRVLLRGVSGPKKLAAPQWGSISPNGVIALDSCGPVAVEWKVGRGTVIATTLEPFDIESPEAHEIITILLTNAGVQITAPEKTQPRVRALRTVPLKLDGQLDDWTNDIEDRNVSPYRHAEPVVLGADTLVEGEVQGDQQLCGIVYFLCDEQSLYVAGVTVGGDRIQIQLGEQTLDLTRQSDKWCAPLFPSSQSIAIRE